MGGEINCETMMEKRKPHYALASIKSAFSNPDTINRPVISKQGSDDLGMDDTDVLAVIQAMGPPDFDKSMTSFNDHRIWQDVYLPLVESRTIYVKFTLDAQQEFLLISFKEA